MHGSAIFLHDRPWISPWIKSISNELDITCHVFASQFSSHCDVITDRLWRHQQNVMRASEPWGLCVEILVSASLMDSLCRVRNEIIYVLLWRTDYALTRVLFWCLFPSLLRNSGNKHQNNPLVSAWTFRHASTYIIIYISRPLMRMWLHIHALISMLVRLIAIGKRGPCTQNAFSHILKVKQIWI